MKTTREIAEILGLAPRRVREIALKHGIGEKHGHDIIYKDSDINKIMAHTRQGRMEEDLVKALRKLEGE